MNNIKMHTNEDVEKTVTCYGNRPVTLTLLRNEKPFTAVITAVKDKAR